MSGLDGDGSDGTVTAGGCWATPSSGVDKDGPGGQEEVKEMAGEIFGKEDGRTLTQRVG